MTKFLNTHFAIVISVVLFSAGSLTAQYFNPPNPIQISNNVHFTPSLSADELEIFYTDWVANGHWDVFTAQRDDVDSDWGPVFRVEEIDTSSREDGVTLSQDGLTMIYASQRSDGLGGFDLWTSTRTGRDDEWSDPVNLSAINTSLDETTPSLSADGKTLYFAEGDWNVSNSSDIWYSTRDDLNSNEWSAPQAVPNVNSNSTDEYVSISTDGLQLYFMSNRAGGFGQEDIYVASRMSTEENFGTPMNLGPVINTTNVDYSPFISTDGSLYYTRDVVRSQSGWEIWKATSADPTLGDLNGDGTLDTIDVNQLTDSIRFRRKNILGFDLDGDGEIAAGDIRTWVKEVKGTWIGDANLDGEFNTSDLTLIFQAGEFEDTQRRNSTWTEGDWNGDLEFDTSDLVSAFQDGGFERGPIIVRTVPEPDSVRFLLSTALLFTYAFGGRRKNARCGSVGRNKRRQRFSILVPL